jgi:hypothetical protein
MYRGVSTSDPGRLIAYVDGVAAAAPYVLLDFGQTAITTLRWGAVSPSVNETFQVYVGNLVISSLDTRDVTSRFTGTFLSQDGKTVTVVNGRTMSVV